MRALPALFLGFLLPGALLAQTTLPPGPESPSAPVAVLAAVLYNDQANLKELTDSAKARLATTVVRDRITEQLGAQVLPYPVVDSLAGSASALQSTGGLPCSVKVACARSVGEQLGAPWVVILKVSKTSNLIWLLSAQLIRAGTGDIILDDTTELKGDPELMVRVGVRQFADRVARTVRQGGYATNYPPPDGQ